MLAAKIAGGNNMSDLSTYLVDTYGRYLSYTQAAKELSTSVRTLKRETARGNLPVYQVGRGRVLRLRCEDVANLVVKVG